VTVDTTGLRFHFKGKGGKTHTLRVRDRRLARLVRRCQDLPGQPLFEYVDATGSVRAIRSDDVNDYLRRVAGAEVSAKDFRTWFATVLAFRALRSADAPSGRRQGRNEVARAMAAVSERLGNTPSVCRASYVHPGVIDAYLDHQLTGRRLVDQHDGPPTPAEERALTRLLRRASGHVP
jgi:DNA topoisomerase-1